MKRIFVLALAMLLLCGCAARPAQETVATAATTQSASTEQTQPAPTATEPAPTEPTEPADPIQALMDTMTTEQKVGQLFVARCPGENAAADAANYHLGGYILFYRDFEAKTREEVAQQVQQYQDAASIPMLIGVDEEGGTVVRASAHFILRETPFQSPQALYAQGGMDAIVADTKEKDALLSSMGINVNFAPVADVSVDPGDFIYDRAFGADAEATAAYTQAVVGQMAQDRMGSVLKHFPGYGSNVDTHTGIAVDQRPLETFLSSDLLPFEAHRVGQGTSAIMLSHNIITCMDPDRPASLSREVNRFLRQDFGFDGVVMTDGLDMGAVQQYADSGNIAVEALAAGNDILLICDYTTGIPAMMSALENGTLTQEQIDTACYRVLTWKQELGLI